jgi:hypothetical protein
VTKKQIGLLAVLVYFLLRKREPGYKFKWEDIMPTNSAGKDHWYEVKTIGRYKLLQGAGVNGGDWMAKGRGESKVYNNRQDAENHIKHSEEEDSSTDASMEELAKQHKPHKGMCDLNNKVCRAYIDMKIENEEPNSNKKKLTARDAELLHRAIDEVTGSSGDEWSPEARKAAAEARKKQKHSRPVLGRGSKQERYQQEYERKAKAAEERTAARAKDAQFTKSFGRGMKKVTRDAGAKGFSTAQNKALRALMRVESTAKDHPKFKEFKQLYDEAVRDLRRAMRARNAA